VGSLGNFALCTRQVLETLKPCPVLDLEPDAPEIVSRGVLYGGEIGLNIIPILLACELHRPPKYVDVLGDIPPLLLGLHHQVGGLEIPHEVLGAVGQQRRGIGRTDQVQLSVVLGVLQDSEGVRQGVGPASQEFYRLPILLYLLLAWLGALRKRCTIVVLLMTVKLYIIGYSST
jgi:hypothetical protein